MARTIQQLIDDVRDILQDNLLDEFGAYRYPDDQLLSYVNAALHELKRERPDAWLKYLGKPLPVVDLNSNFPVNEIFYTPCVNWVAGYAELRDDTFTTDGRAATLLGLFSSELTAPISGTPS